MARKAMLLFRLAAVLVALAATTLAVDHEVFKTCSQSSFCRRCRALAPGTSAFQVAASAMTSDASTVHVVLDNTANAQQFTLSVQALQGNMFRVQIDELAPLQDRKRYRVEDALQRDPTVGALTATETTDVITITSGTNRVVITKKPLKLEFYENNVLVVVANGRGLMRFEHYRTKPDTPGTSIEDQDAGSWTETFGTFTDAKPFGPEAIALDFGFPEAKVLMGIPAHADSLALRSTTDNSGGGSGDPYRLYNLDVAFHELDSRMSLYGAVPVLYGHGARRTAGVFWHNAAETWVDIYNASTASAAPLAANFMSETGIVDAFVLLGPQPRDVFAQYTTLTGVTPLPQLYTLAYHQCRWNYDNETDVMTVASRFEQNDIPLDTMWLDIEYTDQKKYFTWDAATFPNPLGMIGNLSAAGRHLHVICDIHLKYDTSYNVNNDCIAQNLYTKNMAGQDFVGDCWPGAAGYPDVFTQKARDYLATRYQPANFPGTTADVMIWNDMNEPSVFDGPEKTMPKTNLHWDGVWEHRALHNQFGHQQLRSTHQGLVTRGQSVEGGLRPFVLTRSHFAGSQRYAMIWTGDNTADWGYLQVSLKMCLAEAIAGFSFCGADVGGFFNHPDAELFARWYQAAAWTPFYRSHANLGTPRREPWTYDDNGVTMGRIRAAVKRRYVHLPLWYTLMFEHERHGLPVMRPLLTEFPTEEAAFAIDHQFMLGSQLLVHPVMTAGISTARVYLPRATWYDIDTYAKHEGQAAFVELPVDMEKTYVFQRAGTVVPQKRVERKASQYMREDPYTLVVALDAAEKANGTLYVDDWKTFAYRQKKYVYTRVLFDNGTLSAMLVDAGAQWETSEVVERVVLAGVASANYTKATVETGGAKGDEYKVEKVGNTWVLSGGRMRVNENWQLKFSSAAGRLVVAPAMMILGAVVAALRMV